MTSKVALTTSTTIQLHFVRPSSFTRKKRFALKIGVNHDDGRSIVIQITDNCWYRVKSSDLAGMMPPVTSDNLIATFFPWTHDQRDDLTGIQGRFLRAFCS